jgi:hypothetical protein
MTHRPAKTIFTAFLLITASGCNSWQPPTALTLSPTSYFPSSTILPPIIGVQPTLGMSYSEFSAFTRRSGYGDPKRVSTKNNLMIYSLPFQPDIYFWFEHSRLLRVTRLQVDDPSSWEKNEISPSASIVHTPLNPLPVGF